MIEEHFDRDKKNSKVSLDYSININHYILIAKYVCLNNRQCQSHCVNPQIIHFLSQYII